MIYRVSRSGDRAPLVTIHVPSCSIHPPARDGTSGRQVLDPEAEFQSLSNARPLRPGARPAMRGPMPGHRAGGMRAARAVPCGLFCPPLYSALLRSTPLYSALLRSTPLYSALLRSTPLYSTLLRSTPLYPATLRFPKIGGGTQAVKMPQSGFSAIARMESCAESLPFPLVARKTSAVWRSSWRRSGWGTGPRLPF